MTIDNYHKKTLLDYQSELEGMIAENKLRELKGNLAPAYLKNEFADLSYRYSEIMNKY